MVVMAVEMVALTGVLEELWGRCHRDPIRVRDAVVVKDARLL